jgi:hypothetical protein
MSWDDVLKIASQIHDPVSVAAFVAVLAVIALMWAIRAKKPQARGALGILAFGILLLGLAPLATSTFLKSRGIYHVRAVVLGPDGSPMVDAHVSSSSGGEPKKVDGGWEFDIPPQTRPDDGKEILRASVSSAFLTGSSTVFLAQDYYLTTTIQLASDTSAMIRGVVEDERGRSVAGASVSVAGYDEAELTDSMGNFVLPAHAAEGQVVQVRAQKLALAGSLSVPAGRDPVEIIMKHR